MSCHPPRPPNAQTLTTEYTAEGTNSFTSLYIVIAVADHTCVFESKYELPQASKESARLEIQLAGK